MGVVGQDRLRTTFPPNQSASVLPTWASPRTPDSVSVSLFSSVFVPTDPVALGFTFTVLYSYRRTAAARAAVCAKTAFFRRLRVDFGLFERHRESGYLGETDPRNLVLMISVRSNSHL